MNAIGDGDCEKDGRVASKLDEGIGRSEEKQVTIIGLLKFHDFGFELVLMLLQGVASGRKLLGGFRSRGKFLLGG